MSDGKNSQNGLLNKIKSEFQQVSDELLREKNDLKLQLRLLKKDAKDELSDFEQTFKKIQKQVERFKSDSVEDKSPKALLKRIFKSFSEVKNS